MRSRCWWIRTRRPAKPTTACRMISFGDCRAFGPQRTQKTRKEAEANDSLLCVLRALRGQIAFDLFQGGGIPPRLRLEPFAVARGQCFKLCSKRIRTS